MSTTAAPATTNPLPPPPASFQFTYLISLSDTDRKIYERIAIATESINTQLKRIADLSAPARNGAPV